MYGSYRGRCDTIMGCKHGVFAPIKPWPHEMHRCGMIRSWFLTARAIMFAEAQQHRNVRQNRGRGVNKSWDASMVCLLPSSHGLMKCTMRFDSKLVFDCQGNNVCKIKPACKCKANIEGGVWQNHGMQAWCGCYLQAMAL